jgi:DNA primase large subunit
MHSVDVLQVSDLVGTRKVFLNDGFAYVPSDFLCSVITCLFRQQLSRGMVITAGQWATTFEGQENDRLVPILKALANRYLPLEFMP